MNKKLLKIIVLTILLFVSSNFFVHIEKKAVYENKIIYKIEESYISKEKLNYKYIKEVKKQASIMKNELRKYFLLGYCEYYNENIKKAKEYFEKAMRYMKETDEPLIKIYNSLFLTDCLIKDNQYEYALQVVEKTNNCIKEKDYKYVYKQMSNILNLISDTREGNKLAASILKKYASSKTLSYSEKYYINKQLLNIYMLERNYPSSIDITVQTISAAKKLEEEYYVSKLSIDLASILSELKAYTTSELIIRKVIKIDLKNKEEDSKIKQYAFINLAEIYMNLGDYDKAIEYSDKIDEYKKYIDDEEANDYDIVSSSIKAISYINKNDLKQGEIFINKMQEEIKKDNESIIIDKWIYYYHALARLNEFEGKHLDAIKWYEKTLEMLKQRNLSEAKIEILINLLNLAKITDQRELLEKYKEDLMSEYRSNQHIRSRENNLYILDRVVSESKIIEDTQKKIGVYKNIFTSIVVIAFVFALLYKRIQRLKKQNFHDSMTGVFNRRYFDLLYEKYIRKKKNMSIIMIDIDNFKSVNDTYGHKFGDEVIKSVANVLRNTLSDEGKVFRYGGEEFTIITLDKNVEEVFTIAEDIRIAVQSLIFENQRRVTISLGIGTKYEEFDILEEADLNLYMAKKIGKNNVFYEKK